ncbi:MAG: VOC family protein [Salinibacterium sp.]|nr:VOC family protein [Salinibacterium sp.]
MTPWPGNISAITLFADDLTEARQFYIDIFELPVLFEDDSSAVFTFGTTLINLLATREAPDLIAPARVAEAETGARSQFTLDVEDVDATAAELVGKGVTLINGPLDRPWGIRTAAFADPTGTIWEIAAPRSG